ncbi:MAG: hypothetical protein ABIH04_02300 [Planctomycetota bacterium]
MNKGIHGPRGSVSALVLMLFVCAGCLSRPDYAPDFGRVSPNDGEENVATIPTFSWEIEDGFTDVYFQLYAADAYDYERNRATGSPLLQLTGFKPGRNTVSLQNDAELKSRYSAVGPFVDKGLSTLAYNQSYVWVLIGRKNGGKFWTAFRFRTTAKKKD